MAFIRDEDKFYYLACPDCKRKITDSYDGYRCENCQKSFATCLTLYFMTAKLQDISGEMYIQFSRETAEPIMNGKTAQEIRDLKEGDADLKTLINDECLYKVRF